MKKFNPASDDQRKKAYKHVSTVVGDFYGSNVYSKFWTRFDNRLKAYYCQHRTDVAKWRSKLHFATFFLGCKAEHAQHISMHSTWPFVTVNAIDDGTPDPGAVEKAQLASADLNYDLRISGYKRKLMDMYHHVEMCGTAVAREYFRSTQKTRNRRSAETGERYQEVLRQEATQTMVIHPLNFAHDETKRGFLDSQWGSVRFEIPITEVYKMLNHPDYNKPGVQKILENYKDGKSSRFTVGQDSFFSRIDEPTLHRNMIVVNEYVGPINFAGNEYDDTLYYCLYDASCGEFLRISQAPFDRVPYWKMQPYPDADGPFGVGPNDMLLPMNMWKNSTVNQYVDYMNAALKFMYKVRPESIVGGTLSLLDGLPLGIVEVEGDDPEAWAKAIEPIKNNIGSMPAVGDILGIIEKEIENQGPSSNLRGEGSDQLNDTATGISLMAKREDEMTLAIQEGCDEGIRNCMDLKLDHMVQFFNEERIARISEGDSVRRVAHYPYELMVDGQAAGFSFDVQRQKTDQAAAKAMSYLKFITGLNQLTPQGSPPLVPTELIVKMSKRVGNALGLDGVDEDFKEIMASIQQSQQMPMPINPGAAGGPQGNNPVQPPAQTIMQGADLNAMAAAA